MIAPADKARASLEITICGEEHVAYIRFCSVISPAKIKVRLDLIHEKGKNS